MSEQPTAVDRPSFATLGSADRHDHACCDGGKKPPVGLTKNETLVWSALNEAGQQMKAYEILDKLKAQGVRAPMTVYRALDGLEQKGIIHKLEALNSFVICNHNDPHQVQVFRVCEECDFVDEIDIEGLEALISPYARGDGFSMTVAHLELRGVCKKCR